MLETGKKRKEIEGERERKREKPGQRKRESLQREREKGSVCEWQVPSVLIDWVVLSPSRSNINNRANSTHPSTLIELLIEFTRRMSKEMGRRKTTETNSIAHIACLSLIHLLIHSTD